MNHYELVHAILTDHEARILSVPEGYFQPKEVIVQISMMEIRSWDDDGELEASAIVAKLPGMGYGFITLRGTYSTFKNRTLIRDSQEALSQALRRCPDREYRPLVMSVLDRQAVHGALSGVVYDFVGGSLMACQVSSDDMRFKDVREANEDAFGTVMRKTIADYWAYVESLGDL